MSKCTLDKQNTVIELIQLHFRMEECHECDRYILLRIKTMIGYYICDLRDISVMCYCIIIFKSVNKILKK
jgi:hypothetical protein